MYRYFLKTVYLIVFLIIPLTIFSQVEMEKLSRKDIYFMNIKISLDSLINNFLNPLKKDFERFIIFYNSTGSTLIIFEDGNLLKECYLNLKTSSLKNIIIESDFNKSFSGIFSSKNREYKVAKYNNGGNLCVLILFNGKNREYYCFNILNNKVPIKRKYYWKLVQKMINHSSVFGI